MSFFELFPDDLPCIPHKREIDFGFYILRDTLSISIPPYGMALEERNELKEQLKEFLDKCVI